MSKIGLMALLTALAVSAGCTASASEATPTPTQTPEALIANTPIPTPEPTATPTPVPQLVHLVLPGDSLWGIAYQYGVTLESLLEANGLTPDVLLQVGQEIIVPLSAGGQVLGKVLDGVVQESSIGSGGAGVPYVVQNGDSLWSIAVTWGLTVEELAAANGLQTTDLLEVGQILTLPAGQTG